MAVGLFSAVVDANVLYPMPIADTILLAAQFKLFTLHWTPDLIRELKTTMLKNGRTELEAKKRTEAMVRAFAPTEVTGYQGLINGIVLPGPDDRHVVAAAARAGAELIVPSNMKHFPSRALASLNLKVCTPDNFLVDLADAYPVPMGRLLHHQAQQLKKSNISYEQLLMKLEEHAWQFVAVMRELDVNQEAFVAEQVNSAKASNVVTIAPRRAFRRPRG